MERKGLRAHLAISCCFALRAMAGLVSIAGVPRGSHADPLFEAPFLAFGAGYLPTDPQLADLDRDGRLDVVVANGGDTTVSVLLGNGDGTFGEHRDHAVAPGPWRIAVADLDRNGTQDVVVGCLGGSVSVLLGNGDGTLGSRTDYPTGQIWSIAVGDLNGDEIPDLAFSTRSTFAPGTLSLLFGNGDGTFGTRHDLSTGGWPGRIAIGDLNRDSHSDLVFTLGSVVSLWLGNGDGTFQPGMDIPVTAYPEFVAIADLNGDQKLDLAIHTQLGSVSVLLGNGDGTFGMENHFAAESGGGALAVGDLNADGHPDLAVANGRSERLSIFLGNGDGTFQPREESKAEGTLTCVVPGDLNADGWLDLVATGGMDWSLGNSNSVSVLLGRGDGSFGFDARVVAGRIPVSVATGDVNGDGRLDVAIADENLNGVSVLLGTGNGTFGARSDYATGDRPASVVCGDANGDGALDLVVANSQSNTVSVLLGRGDGTFAAKSDYTAGLLPVFATLGDLNGDSRPDLVVANSQSHSVWVRLGYGFGRFGMAVEYAVPYWPTNIAIGDLDGDSRPDLVVANGVISVLRGVGDGTFGDRVDLDTQGGGTWVAIADLNRDARPDLVVSGAWYMVGFLPGDGHGAFGPETLFMPGIRGYSAALADLDGDGRLDIAVSEYYTGAVAVALGNDGGTFGSRVDFGVGSNPSSIAVGDVDGNRRPDLLVANSGSGFGFVSVLLNRGRGTPVEVADLVATRLEDRVRLSWRLASSTWRDLAGVVVERADGPLGPFVARTLAPLLPDRTMSFEDDLVERGRDYWYRLVLLGTDGVLAAGAPVETLDGRTTSRGVILQQPFEPSGGGPVQIRFVTSRRDAPVQLDLFDARGRLVWRTRTGLLETGAHSTSWDRHDRLGAEVPRGVYLLRLEAGGLQARRKLVLLHRR